MRKLSLAEVMSDFVSLVYPAYCLACSSSLFKGEEVVCSRCMLNMPQTNQHLDYDNALMRRFIGRLPLVLASALFRFSKSGTIQHLLHQLKYKNHPEVGVVLGKLYGSKLKSSLPFPVDLIIPVPLHPTRLRRRGYNQSGKFAEGLSAELSVPFTDDVMRRNVKTSTQTRKSKLMRWENVDHIFSVINPAAVKDQHVLLVDDVITTGATIEACGNALLESGCRALSIACIAEA
jgi:ComF family protein